MIITQVRSRNSNVKVFTKDLPVFFKIIFKSWLKIKILV
jgi:hypothetical protein